MAGAPIKKAISTKKEILHIPQAVVAAQMMIPKTRLLQTQSPMKTISQISLAVISTH